MKITADGTKGFSGQSEHYEIDTTRTPGGRGIEASLRAGAFFSAPSSEVVGADLPRWQITVDDAGRSHTIRFADDGGPEAVRWQGLLAEIRAAA